MSVMFLLLMVELYYCIINLFLPNFSKVDLKEKESVCLIFYMIRK